MSKILIDKIRIDGFRGLKNFCMSLSEVTVLTGMNNVGKTSILKALQLLFGNSSFLTPEDLHMENDSRVDRIIVDANIIAVNDDGTRAQHFPDVWEIEIGENFGRFDADMYAYLPLRVVITYQSVQNTFKKELQILDEWETAGIAHWQNVRAKKFTLKSDVIQFFYMDAKRDIQDDVKSRTSYLGKMLGDVVSNYDPEVVAELERQIKELNDKAIDESAVLKTIQETLAGIDTAMDTSGKVSISPFAKKLRDLNKSLTIHYGTGENSFTMDYHGMGTRSWSSLLSFKAFIKQANAMKNPDDEAFLPIIAIEEPEAHLHPNAQKQLYSQMADMPGIKIISTHSPYIAACAKLSEIRGVYKVGDNSVAGNLPIGSLDVEDKRKIRQAVLSSNGEILFSKAVVLGEGETEVQALPIFAEKHFTHSIVELGLSFIDAKGCGNYYPFVILAKSLNIPWYIFSDGEEKTIKDLKKLVERVYGDGTEIAPYLDSKIFVIPNGKDFEGMLIADGYIEEIEKSIKIVEGNDDAIDVFIDRHNHRSKGRVATERTCPTCRQKIYEDVERIYDGPDGRLTALDDIMEKHKAQLGPVLAENIVASEKDLPDLVVRMYNKMKSDLHYV